MPAYYLRADGSNSNTGLGTTPGTAWLTLNYACTVMVAGDTLYIMDAGGIFYLLTEHSFKPVGALGNLITITNYPTQSPIFSGKGGTHSGNDNVLLVAAGSQYADIGGFTVQENNESVSNRGRGMSISSAVSPAKANNLILRNITVHDVYLRGLGICGYNIDVISCEVYNAVMHNVAQALGSGGWATGIATVIHSDNSVPTNITFTDCYSHNNWGEGFDAFQVDGVTFTQCVSLNNFSVLFYNDKARNITYDRCDAIFNDSTYQRDRGGVIGNSDGFSMAAEGAGTPNPDFSPANIDNITFKNCNTMGCRFEYHYFHTGNTSVNNTYRNILIYYGSSYGTTDAGLDFDDVDAAHTAPSGNVIRNLISYGAASLNDTAGWTFSNNNYVDGIPGAGTHTDCIAADPGYTNPSVAIGDVTGMRLLSTSPCIGAGIDVAGITTDYDGNSRATDIGAFEYITSGSGGTTDASVSSTVSALSGAARTGYYLIVNDAFGNRLAVIADYEALAAKRTVNGVGVLVFSVPGYYSLDTFKVDGVVELWRAPKGGSWRLEFDQLWFIRERYKVIEKGVRSWRIVAYDLNYLLGEPSGKVGRIVSYTSDYRVSESSVSDAYTDKAGTADNIIKRIARENMGDLVLSPTRNLLAYYLSFQVALSAAAVVSMKMERRNLLSLFQELCQASTTAGTYLAFDIVCLAPPVNGVFSIQLQTFTGQRGIDHRSAQSVLIGPDFGNLDDVVMGFVNTDEVTFVYAAGQNESANQALITSSDTTRMNISPFNRRETFVSVGQSADPVVIQDEADTRLRAGRPLLTLSGTLIDTDQARYGIHWGLGDYVPVQVDGYTFEARLDTVQLSVSRNSDERISVQIRAESLP